MGKIKKILVATDFSEQANLAILRAVEIAQLTGAVLTIIHIAQKRFLTKVMKEIVPAVSNILITPEERALSLLKHQVDKLSRNNLKIQHVIISAEQPALAILKYTKSNKIDLLVMGSHGEHAMRNFFVGTTAEYLAKKSRCPVLIVKKSLRRSYHHILIPIDFSAASKEALQFADDLFPKANFHVLHVGDHAYQDLLKMKSDIPKTKIKVMQQSILLFLANKMKEFIKSCGTKRIKISSDIKFGYPGVVIADQAKRLNQDLVIMGTQGHRLRHYLFIGRVASRVLLEVDRDILLVPAKKK